MKIQSYAMHRTELLLMVFCGLFASVNSAFTQTWTQTGSPSNYWESVASSADGTKLVAAVYGGGIYTSTNSGITWALTSAPSDGQIDSAWYSVASSADGTKLVAVAYYGNPIYVSTNSGMDWATNGPVESWQSVACSADGNKLVAVVGPYGPIFTSTNCGTTWAQATNVPNEGWVSVASSADGTKLVAAAGDISFGPGPIYFSTNSGAFWVKALADNLEWVSVASSADGRKMVAVANNGQIWTSKDSGMTWGPDYVSSEPWSSVASSADGTKLIAVAYNASFSSGSGLSLSGGIFASTNSGLTWIQTIGPSNCWFSVATSADGNKSVVAVNDGLSLSGADDGVIYSSQTTPAPQLNLTPTDGSLMFSWLIPSTKFVMQQCSDLISWTDVTIEPVLNLSNLQNQITFLPTNGSHFYRLATP
jgi:photosystem II stability/assembly factor-like uncharacterized protein